MNAVQDMEKRFGGSFKCLGTDVMTGVEYWRKTFGVGHTIGYRVHRNGTVEREDFEGDWEVVNT